MDFFTQVDRAQDLVKRHGRVSAAGLGREFSADGETVEAIAEELRVRGVARWDGTALIATTASETEPKPTAGEIRHLTVMFCDVIGSTELSGQLDAEEWTEAMRAFHEMAGEAIRRWQGHVGNYLGDGLVAYFGYPIAKEDAAERAIRAGLTMLSSLKGMNEDIAVTTGADLNIRVGIHTGPLVVDRFGGVVQGMGQTVNIAARVEGAAPANSVVVSAATQRLVAGLFLTEDLGPQSLKGVVEPVGLTRILRLAGTAPRLVAARNFHGPLVGREAELEELHRCWRRTQEGNGQAAVVTGEAGIGKSRLIDAFRQAVHRDAHTWLEVFCSPYSSSSSLQPFVDLQQRRLGFLPESSAETKRRLLTGALSVLGLERHTAVLCQLHGIEDSLQVDAEQKRLEVFQVLSDWLFAISEIQPTVLFVDDVHWVDPTSGELLKRLVDQGGSRPLLLVVSSRPGGVTRLDRRGHVSSIELDRLTEEQTQQIVLSHAVDGLPESTVKSILERAEGNPLFAEELAFSAGQSRGTEFQVPDSLENLLMARLEQHSGLRPLAQEASIVGREFRLEELALVSDLPDSEMTRLLTLGVETGFFLAGMDDASNKYTFRHALMRDAAYESMLKRTRRERHHKFAKALLEVSISRGVREDLIAEHFTAAEARAEASHWWQQAAERALSNAAATEAQRFYRRAIETSDPLDHERLVHLNLWMTSAMNLSGSREAEAQWQVVADLAGRHGHRWEKGAAHAGLALRLITKGEFAEAKRQIGTLRRIATELEANDLRFNAVYLDMMVANFEGRPEYVVKQAKAAAAAGYRSSLEIDRAVVAAAEPSAHAYHAYSLAQMGRFSEGSALLEETIRLVNLGAARPATLANALTLRSTNALFRGDFPLYEILDQEFLSTSKRFELKYYTMMGETKIATVGCILRPSDASFERAKDRVDRLLATNTIVAGPIFYWLLAKAALSANRPDDVLAALEAAEAMAEKTGQRWVDCHILACRLRVQRLVGTLEIGWVEQLQQTLAFAQNRHLTVGALELGVVQLELVLGTPDEQRAVAQLQALLAAMPETDGVTVAETARKLLALAGS